MRLFKCYHESDLSIICPDTKNEILVLSNTTLYRIITRSSINTPSSRNIYDIKDKISSDVEIDSWGLNYKEIILDEVLTANIINELKHENYHVELTITLSGIFLNVIYAPTLYGKWVNFKTKIQYTSKFFENINNSIDSIKTIVSNISDTTLYQALDNEWFFDLTYRRLIFPISANINPQKYVDFITNFAHLTYTDIYHNTEFDRIKTGFIQPIQNSIETSITISPNELYCCVIKPDRFTDPISFKFLKSISLSFQVAFAYITKFGDISEFKSYLEMSKLQLLSSPQ